MGKNTFDYRYDFVQKLCLAIELLTKIEVEKNERVFYFKNSNLRFAYERAMYISYVNNNILYNLFLRYKRNSLPPIIFYTDSTLKVLMNLMCENSIKSVQIVIFGRFLEFAVRVLKIPIKILLTLFSYDKKTKKSNKEILIYVNHIKFVKYLSVIVSELKSSEYLTRNKECFNYCNKNSLLCTKVNLVFNTEYNVFKYNHLAKFFLDDLYKSFYIQISRSKPKLVILIEGNSPEDEIINQICKKLSIKTICIQQGWSPFVHNGFRNMSFSKMLVWGKGFVDLLTPYNKDQKFVTTGNHVINNQRVIRTKKRKRVSFFLQTPSPILSEENFYKLIELALWCANRFKNYEIYIREHPAFKLDEHLKEDIKRNLNILIDPNINLNRVLDESYISVSIYSSTILESIAADVVPLIYNITSMPRYNPDVSEYKAGVEVKNLGLAKMEINKLLTDYRYYRSFNKGMENFRTLYFNDTNAVKNIAREIEVDT